MRREDVPIIPLAPPMAIPIKDFYMMPKFCEPIKKSAMEEKKSELYEYFEEALTKELTNKKNIKGVIIDKDDVNAPGVWDVCYKGQVFVIEFYQDTYDSDGVWVMFRCDRVETSDGDIDVTGYNYGIDDTFIKTQEDANTYIDECVSAIKECFISSNVSRIIKKVSVFAEFLRNLDGWDANEDIARELLLRENII